MLVLALCSRKVVNELGPRVVGRLGLDLTLCCLTGSMPRHFDLFFKIGEVCHVGLGLLVVRLLGCHHRSVMTDLFIDSAEGSDDIVDFSELVLRFCKGAANVFKFVAICKDVAAL